MKKMILAILLMIYCSITQNMLAQQNQGETKEVNESEVPAPAPVISGLNDTIIDDPPADDAGVDAPAAADTPSGTASDTVANKSELTLIKEWFNNLKYDTSEVKILKFVGGGDLNRIDREMQDITAGNVSLGCYFLREYPPERTSFIEDLEVDFAMNLASSVDSIKGFLNGRDFGNYILQPINSKYSARLNMTFMLKDNVKYRNARARLASHDLRSSISEVKKKIKEKELAIRSMHLLDPNRASSKKELRFWKDSLQVILYDAAKIELDEKKKIDDVLGDYPAQTNFNRFIEGFYVNMYADRSDWELEQADTSNIVTNVNTFQFQTGLFHELFPDRMARKNQISAKIGAGYSLRFISGDIHRNNMISTFLNSHKRFYHGLDFFASFQFDQLKAEVTIPYIWKGDNNHVNGLTGSNLLLSIRFIGGFDIFRSGIKKKVKSIEMRG